ncbi:UDP-N-acetylmuramoyl-L-alanyl-D-glutamate--2,6-diaminopimelate ligase [Hydrogenibacillus sp. N12]|uniref:UDP-N-acetylmuramoyl-L-alanyl-D-glutamate--2, 6-diaminopimelate ligase n=1 Tax=Hydrogenibacillus sp. N12 TaxID=2866627 RepID=UPI001C7E01F6|nr:UDP-N-acetylmuramoyl-L-alanyl-D-glutamate--2,6-diaminopimelate ligase [Hydrogenibacillus sp. N12]QZA33948.1 UDP-N-acetylmuramoyl-L-alanyl-D-glutamate--2,6-diaminopimelate ligase [Hydrogenibacillus sp. N12]
MRLVELVQTLPFARLFGAGETAVDGVAIDSRRVRPGDLFVALPGTRADGHAFLAEAAAAGARAAVVARGYGEAAARTFLAAVEVAEPKRALPLILAAFYGQPADGLHLIGVTGTNGKTTTTALIRHVLEAAGVPTGLIGTVEVAYGDRREPAQATTPDPVALFATLRMMRAAGVRAVAMEVSSHALDQGRVAGLRFDQAVFTNLTQDHLDYHGTMEAYRAAKARLFQGLGFAGGVAVLNADDPAASFFAGETVRPVVRYGLLRDGERPEERFRSGVDVLAAGVRLDRTGSSWTLLAADGRSAPVEMRLIGRHNVENALAAAASALAFGLDVGTIAEGLRTAAPVAGRLERIDCGQPFSVFVDYAHTPDGIRQVLAAVRPFARRLIVVFGAGGNRDAAKRPLMGRAAAEGADALVVTSDNPRDEDPEAIIRDILAGIPAEARERTIVEVDRRRAIERAVALAEAGDVVVIAGKGHETGQIVRGTVHPFDDRVEARRALEGGGFRCS